MPAKSEALVVTDSKGQKYWFRLAQRETGARRVSWQSVPLQPSASNFSPWREPLHRVYGGVARDRRIGNGMSYHSANADLSWDGVVVFPPDVTVVSVPLATRFIRAIYWNGKLWVLAGRALYSVDSSNAVSLEKDFVTDYGGEALDMTLFNDELVFAMGDLPLVTYSPASGWRTAEPSVTAYSVGAVGERLWRAASGNKVVACFADPLAASSWAPSLTAPEVPVVGDETYRVHTILEYGGVPWAIKGDGVYQPDPVARFYQQSPQLRNAPHDDNGRGSWVAMGYLWVPYTQGLLRIAPGESILIGREILERGRPNARIWAGTEFKGCLWLVVTDGFEYRQLFKVQRDFTGRSGKALVWHQLAVLPPYNAEPTDTEWGLVAANIGANPPSLVIAQGAKELLIVSLGSGGGRDIDDPSYTHGGLMEWVTGSFSPSDPDDSVQHVLAGVELVCDVPAGDRLTVYACADPRPEHDPEWVELRSSFRGGVVSPVITNTGGRARVVRYPPAPLEGKRFSVRIEGSSSAVRTPQDRTEIYQVWAYGYSRPKHSDVLEVTIYASHTTVDGRRNPLSPEDVMSLIDKWVNSSEQLQLELGGYAVGDEDDRWLAVEYSTSEMRLQVGAAAGYSTAHAVTVRFVRLEYGE